MNPWHTETDHASTLAFLERLKADGLPPYEPPVFYVSRAEYDRLQRADEAKS